MNLQGPVLGPFDRKEQEGGRRAKWSMNLPVIHTLPRHSEAFILPLQRGYLDQNFLCVGPL